jgi:nucleoside phosphorylase/ADP-ribose pyrophosphatase YjhB (NUDIX family)
MEKEGIDFFVLTALPEEIEPLLRRLPEPRDVGSGFSITRVSTENGRRRNILLYLPGSGQGTNTANTITTHAINHYHPHFILLVGIAAGFSESKVCLGDVLVPEYIDAYELAKKVAIKPKVQYRQPNYDVTASNVVEQAKLINQRPQEWHSDIKEVRPNTLQRTLPQIHAIDRGVLGSGDKNLANIKARERKHLIQNHQDRALGADMEAAGLATACKRYMTPYAVIKGVQDDGTLSKDDSNIKDLWRSYAADAAAALTILIIRRLVLDNMSVASEPIDKTTPPSGGNLFTREEQFEGGESRAGVLPVLGTSPKSSVKSQIFIEQMVASTKSEEIIKTEKALGESLFGIDGLIILWMSNRPTGIEATAIEVTPKLPLTGDLESVEDLPLIPGFFLEHAAPYKSEAEKRFGNPNNPKLWLRTFKSPMTDRPQVCLTIGRSDYWTARSIEMAFDNGTLRNAYESHQKDIDLDLPGMIGTHSIILTSDNYLILAQRKGNDVDFAGGNYSPSFEEQWNPLCDGTPYEAVLRGLSEEFNLDPIHGVYVSVDNLRLLAFGREWGRYWHTIFLYLVRLPATAEKVIECWNAVPPPKDKNEHIGVVTLPISKGESVDFLHSFLTNPSSKVSADEIKRLCSNRMVSGRLSDGNLHPTSGRARTLLTLSACGHIDRINKPRGC